MHTIRHQADLVALIDGPGADRGSHHDRHLKSVRVVVEPPPATRRALDVEKDCQLVARRRLEDLDLKPLGARGRRPVDTAQAIARSVLANATESARVVEEPAPRSQVAERLMRWQP